MKERIKLFATPEEIAEQQNAIANKYASQQKALDAQLNKDKETILRGGKVIVGSGSSAHQASLDELMDRYEKTSKKLESQASQEYKAIGVDVAESFKAKCEDEIAELAEKVKNKEAAAKSKAEKAAEKAARKAKAAKFAKPAGYAVLGTGAVVGLAAGGRALVKKSKEKKSNEEIAAKVAGTKTFSEGKETKKVREKTDKIDKISKPAAAGAAWGALGASINPVVGVAAGTAAAVNALGKEKQKIANREAANKTIYPQKPQEVKESENASIAGETAGAAMTAGLTGFIGAAAGDTIQRKRLFKKAEKKIEELEKKQAEKTITKAEKKLLKVAKESPREFREAVMKEGSKELRRAGKIGAGIVAGTGLTAYTLDRVKSRKLKEAYEKDKKNSSKK